MVLFVFRCGNCRGSTASKPKTWNTPQRNEYEEAMDNHPLQVAVTCTVCGQINTLHYVFGAPGPWNEDHTRGFLIHLMEGDVDHTVTTEPDTQWPRLYPPPPAGLMFTEGIVEAWQEAVRAFAAGNIWNATCIAFRRVLEFAVKALDEEARRSSREMLGQRIARLEQAGQFSRELAQLLRSAKAFGDDAAHTSNLTREDAEMARDLCEAVLRQCFSVPHLMHRATQHQSDRDRGAPAFQVVVARGEDPA